MNARDYSFDGQLLLSHGTAASADVQAVLLQNIPGAVAAYPAARANDRQGIDWWLEMSSARHLGVDVKVRSTDWAAAHGEDDLALESWSVIERQVPGWTRDPAKRCDFILWLWQDTHRFCFVPFPMLCAVFGQHWQHWCRCFKTRRQSTPDKANGYHSECVFVPRREVWKQIYLQFGGQP